MVGSAIQCASASADDLQVSAFAASDWMYHGTTETEGKPAFGLAADWQITPRVFAGIEAHQAIVKGDPQRQRSVMAYLGAGQSLGENWFLSGTVSHREFPGGKKEWDFTEFSVELNHTTGWSLQLDYSPDYYEHNTSALAGEVRYNHRLTQRLHAYAEFGAIEFSSGRFTDYGYGQVGFGASISSVALDVAYRRNSEGSSSEFGLAPYSNASIVVQLSFRIR